MVKAFQANRADQSFNVRRLPRRSKRDGDLLDAHVFHALLEFRSVDPITITKQICWCFIPWKRFDDLLDGPLLGGMCGHIEVDHSAPVVTQYDEAEQQLKSDGRHSKEINGHDAPNVVVQERSPCLRRRSVTTDHVFLNLQSDFPD